MQNNFWSSYAKASEDKTKLKKNKKPILAMAPMAGYTDSAFRQICKSFGADVLYTEMASAAALFYNQETKNNPTLDLLKFSKKEKPIIAQLFGNNPEHFTVATQIVNKKIKPNGIDINFGCPVPKVAKQKAGAELFKDLKLSRKVIKATINNTDLPVSIKTRTQAGKVDVLRFLDNISDLDVKAVMIHGRTLKQGFVGPIDTKIIKEARNYFGGIILANGGIENREESLRILKETQADGLGIGRGALGRPWIFKNLKNNELSNFKTGKKEIKKTILKHAKLVNKLRGEAGIIEMRKHLFAYVHGLQNARVLREKFIHVNNLGDIKNVLRTFNIR